MERRFDERNGQEKNDMEFRDLKLQYRMLKEDMDKAIMQVMSEADFISGMRVTELEKQLAAYVGVKYCISCGNGTDAITLALMAWKIGPGDAVFVPDFTFFQVGNALHMRVQHRSLWMYMKIHLICRRNLWRMRLSESKRKGN